MKVRTQQTLLKNQNEHVSSLIEEGIIVLTFRWGERRAPILVAGVDLALRYGSERQRGYGELVGERHRKILPVREGLLEEPFVGIQRRRAVLKEKLHIK